MAEYEITESYKLLLDKIKQHLPNVEPLLAVTIACVDYENPKESVWRHFFPLGVKAIIKYDNGTGPQEGTVNLDREVHRLSHIVKVGARDETTNEVEVMIPANVESLVMLASNKRIEYIRKGELHAKKGS